jgi:hypothetical protein
MAKRKGKQNNDNNKAANGGWKWRMKTKTDDAGEQRIFGSLDAKMDADPLLQQGTQTRSQCLISSNPPPTKTTRSFQMQARVTWRDLQGIRR